MHASCVCMDRKGDGSPVEVPAGPQKPTVGHEMSGRPREWERPNAAQPGTRALPPQGSAAEDGHRGLGELRGHPTWLPAQGHDPPLLGRQHRNH